jgi:hypothetical protein
MSRLALMVRTILRLGLRNVARVVIYKLRLKTGWRPRPLETVYPGGMIFDWGLAGLTDENVLGPTTLSVFGWHKVLLDAPPDWHSDPFGCATRLNHDQDWVKALVALGDSDVKPYWEFSRFYWLPQFALAARNGDRSAADRAEYWLQDWISNNPQYRGINWACGQEAAIRLMNLALSALILDTWRSPSPAMKWLIEAHARRIQPTLSYAIGQDNNHGTTEACALFIVGTWGKVWTMPGAEQIARTGRKWLNDRALRIIQPDGSPAQYSTTYHRANLEAFCMAGLWSMRTENKGLGKNETARVIEGARWLHSITDPETGDAPNIGANDGSNLFNVPASTYRDFRPTVAMAAALFDCSRPWPNYDDPRLAELYIPVGTSFWKDAASTDSCDGGFALLRKEKAIALLRYPRFKFRPSQSDLLHVDLWVEGKNILRDAGTYSYNTDPQWISYFGGCASHNTVQFDGRDQMPRLGRFLLGDWPTTEYLQPLQDDGQTAQFAASYCDSKGARHRRKVCLQYAALQVKDEVQGFAHSAVLRWRLMPGDWRLEQTVEGASLKLGAEALVTLRVSASVPITRCELVQGWESLHYLEKTPLSVLEVEVREAGTLITEVLWTQ